MAITYQQVYDAIEDALTDRTPGTKVQVSLHEVAEKKLLEYIEQLKNAAPVSTAREAHAAATAGVNCGLVWNTAFTNTNYSYFVNGFNARGIPVEITIISKSATNIIVKTIENATMMAIALPYGLPE